MDGRGSRNGASGQNAGATHPQSRYAGVAIGICLHHAGVKSSIQLGRRMPNIGSESAAVCCRRIRAGRQEASPSWKNKDGASEIASGLSDAWQEPRFRGRRNSYKKPRFGEVFYAQLRSARWKVEHRNILFVNDCSSSPFSPVYAASSYVSPLASTSVAALADPYSDFPPMI